MSERKFLHFTGGDTAVFSYICDRCGKWISRMGKEIGQEPQEEFDALFKYKYDLCPGCRAAVQEIEMEE